MVDVEEGDFVNIVFILANIFKLSSQLVVLVGSVEVVVDIIASLTAATMRLESFIELVVMEELLVAGGEAPLVSVVMMPTSLTISEDSVVAEPVSLALLKAVMSFVVISLISGVLDKVVLKGALDPGALGTRDVLELVETVEGLLRLNIY